MGGTTRVGVGTTVGGDSTTIVVTVVGGVRFVKQELSAIGAVLYISTVVTIIKNAKRQTRRTPASTTSEGKLGNSE